MSLSVKSIKSLVPLLDRVLVQRVKVAEKTASGIFLPTAAQSAPPPEALVLAVGPGMPNKKGDPIPVSVAAGDKVIIPGFGGYTVKVGEEEFTFFRDHEIVAKISEK